MLDGHLLAMALEDWISIRCKHETLLLLRVRDLMPLMRRAG
jgi:hypothetical protein